MGLAADAVPWIAAAAAAPDDEAPRRALAAWLTERGHPLGEFMTLQLDRFAEEARTARPQPRPSLDESKATPAAERAWRELAPALTRLGERGGRLGLLRGMPEALTVTWVDLEEPSWLDAMPLAHLDVIGEVPPGGIAALLAVARAHPLRSLALVDCGLDDDDALALAAASWPRLRWLDLTRNRIGERGAEALVAARGWPALVIARMVGNLADPTEVGLTAYDVGDTGPDRHSEDVVETSFSPWAEAVWRRHREPSWARLLWRRAAHRPHRWNLWSGLPTRDLRHDDLEGAVILGGQLDGLASRGARWRGSNLAATTIVECDFSAADLSEGWWRRTAILRTRLNQAMANHLDLAQATLTDCDLAGADLRGASLEGATLVDCRLRGARLGCDDRWHDVGRTRGTRFIRCDLREVDLDGRELNDVALVDCKLGGMRGTPWSTERSAVRRGDLSAAADGSRMIGEATLAEVLELLR
jgi:uncharacterized protein YjbI with pentapeptide repeats